MKKGSRAVRALAAAPLLALLCFAISAAGAGAAAPTGTRIVAPKPLIPHGAKPLGELSPGDDRVRRGGAPAP